MRFLLNEDTADASATEIDRQGQPDRARTNDDDLCLLHRIFRPPLSEESRGQCYCSQVAFDNPTRVSLDYDDVFTA